MRKRLGRMTLTVLVLAAGQAGAQSTPPTGSWAGVGKEFRKGNVYATYRVELRLNGRAGGTVRYPRYKCGGRLRYISYRVRAYRYRETITYGNCMTGGDIAITPKGNRLSWLWINDRRQILVHGYLSRIAVSHPVSPVRPAPDTTDNSPRPRPPNTTPNPKKPQAKARPIKDRPISKKPASDPFAE